MKKMMRKLMVLGLMAPFFMACSADEEMEKSSLNVTDGLNQTYDIQSEDLVGTWNLVSMNTVAVPVDLNLDETQSNDVMTETRCFDQMSFTFDLDGNVTTQQAKLDFDTSDGKMSCQQGSYNAVYEVNGNELKVGFSFGGTTAYQTRTIDVYTVGGEDFLQLDLTYAEAQQYIKDTTFVSPTGATNVKAVEMLYQRQ